MGWGLMVGEVSVHWQPGRDSESSVATLIMERAAREPPLLTWAEPDVRLPKGGAPGRLAGFTPLTIGGPTWPADIALAEARLFWKDKSLHAVAAGRGCQWVELEEASVGPLLGRFQRLAGLIGNWFATRAELPKAPIKADRPEGRVQKLMYPVHTVQDTQRFGLQPADIGGDLKLSAIEYRQSGRLVAWRLVPEL